MAAAGNDESTEPEAHLTVIIVDDHELIRQGLAGLLRGCPDMQVVGECADGSSAVSKALAVRPSVVLMDVRMPGMDGIEATRRIMEALPNTRVVGLSMRDDALTIRQMMAAGAAAYVTKGAPIEELICAIRGQTKAA